MEKIYIKQAGEIEAIRQGGTILARILRELEGMVAPGVGTAVLEAYLVSGIEAAGGRPAFLGYPMGGNLAFPSALCASINEEVVHGTALPNRILVSGDIIDLDIGMEWPVDPALRRKLALPTNPHSPRGGYYTDTCLTVGVGKIGRDLRRLLSVTEEALYAGIKQAKAGNSLADIGQAIQATADHHGYGVVQDLVGHGVGYFAHEDPNVFNYAIPRRSRENIVLQEGMVIAIEPMFNLGGWAVAETDNGMTIVTADGSPSAHFEHTVAITKDGPSILTSYER